MLKLTFLIRNTPTFFLLTLICFGCATPEVSVTHEPPAPPALPVKSETPVTTPPCPRVEPEPVPVISRTVPVTKERKTIVQTAMTALGTPYLWGGLSPKGFDCSGLVVYSYAKLGIHVPRTAKAQFKRCTSVSRKEIRPGDLVFFSVARRRGVIHVGIYIGEGQFVHAPGRGRKVTRASLDNIYFRQHFIRAGNFFKKIAG